MNIWTNHKCLELGYHCTLNEVITFRKGEKETIIAEVNALFSAQGEPFFFKATAPSDMLPIKQQRISYLLKQGFVPLMNRKDKTITLESLSKSNLSSKEQLIVSIKGGIDYLNNLLLKKCYPELICPITKTVFENPVIDIEGHSFEKNAILEHLKTKNICPVNQHQILGVRPDITTQELVAQAKKKPQIPLLPIMLGKSIKEDREEAAKLLKLAKLSVERGKYPLALDFYSDAFCHTANCEDYEELPPLFAKMNEPLKAALAYLHLAMRQIEEGKSAERSLEKAFECAPPEEFLIATRASSLQLQGKNDDAVSIFCALAKDFAKSKDTHKAMLYWEQALRCCPDDLKLYEEASLLLHVDNQTKVRLFLLGLTRFYKTNKNAARAFYEKARKLQPENPMVIFALLNCLCKNDPDKTDLYRILIKLFIDRNEKQNVDYCFNKVLKYEQKLEDIENYAHYLLEKGQKEEAEKVTLQFLNLIQDETKILATMQTFGRKTPFLEKLLSIYEERDSLISLESLIMELAYHYQEQKNTKRIEEIYRLDYEKLRHFESSFRLAIFLAEQGKNAESIGIFYDLSTQSFFEHETDKASRCLQKLKELKAFSLLSPQEQQVLSMQTNSISLHQQIREINQQQACIMTMLNNIGSVLNWQQDTILRQSQAIHFMQTTLNAHAKAMDQFQSQTNGALQQIKTTQESTTRMINKPTSR